MTTIATAAVIVGDRYRRDPGDLAAMADSIREVGLLHPIVVTSDDRLVCGERRLRACRDLLGWEEIPARVVDDCPPDAGEFHENEARKDLAPSERVKLVEALRSDRSANWHSGRFVAKQVTTEDTLEEHGKSRRDHFRAAKVVRDGVPELVSAMDAGEVSIGAAAVIAAQPEDRQREIVVLPARARREEVRRLRQARTKVAKRPRRGKPSAAGLAGEMHRLASKIDDARESAAESRAGRDKARAAIARLRESLDALEAAFEAAPAPKRKPRRSKPAAPRQRPAVMSEDALDRRWGRLHDAQRAQATLKAKIAVTAVDARDRDGVKLRAACEAAAQGTEWSAATVLDWIYGKSGAAGLADYPRHLWPLAMAPKHSGGSAEAECDPAAWECFKLDFLRPEQPPLEMCFRNLQRLAKSEGWTIPRSAAALQRRLDREVPRAAQVLARKGSEALSKMRPPQIRSREELRALEAVNGDARESDVFVRWPDGKIARPWLMSWGDVGFSKILSWRVDQSENSDGYRLAFADLLEDYGIPKHVFMDNGRAFAAKGLTGGAKSRYRFKVKPDDPVGLLTQMVGPEGIHWTKPYHGQSKPIERAFRDMASDIDKDHRLRGAYTGNKPDAKPENYGSKAIPLEKFLDVVADGVRRHNARSGRRGLGLDGRSFDEAFQASYERHAADIPKPTEAQLTRWLLGAMGITAHKNSGAVELFGSRYWSERLAERLAGRSADARKVVVRFDPDRLDRPVTVETLEGSLIGKAKPDGAVRFIDTRAARETARDQARLRRHAREQLKIQGRMDDRELDRLLDESDAETREAEAPPARLKLVAGAFDREPPTAKPVRRSAAATGTDNLIRMMAAREFGPIEDEEE